MKGLLAAILVIFLLSGCAAPVEMPTTQPSETVELPYLGAPGRTAASVVLGDIWAQYDAQERFAIYGGMMTHPVPDAPGDLDLERPEQWVMSCRFPVDCLELVEEGAAMTHLLNETLLTAVAVRVRQEQSLLTLLNNWRWEIQHGTRQLATPQRLLLAQVGKRHLVMAAGSREYVRTFRQKLLQAYPSATVVFEESITS